MKEIKLNYMDDQSQSQNSSENQPQPAPQAAPPAAHEVKEIEPPKQKFSKKVSLALGGGGARGFAHIGILEVLEKYGVEIERIAGTSMGAIMGAMYALGTPLNEMKRIIMNFQKIEFDPSQYLNILHESVLKDDLILDALNQIFKDATFSDCRIPFKTVAVDLESGKDVLFNKGLLRKAIRASISIPIIFPPTFYQDRYLIDGGVLNNVPLTCLREDNPEVLVGVKIVNFTSKQYISGMVYAKYHQKKYSNMFKRMNFIKNFVDRTKKDMALMIGIALRAMDIAAKDSTERRIAEAKPDLLIEPNIQCGLLEFNKAEVAIEEGRRCMEENIPKLIEIIK